MTIREKAQHTAARRRLRLALGKAVVKALVTETPADVADALRRCREEFVHLPAKPCRARGGRVAFKTRGGVRLYRRGRRGLTYVETQLCPECTHPLWRPGD